VFLDDEPLGTTDPVSGRWVKSGVRPGMHHLRLAAPRYVDLIQQLKVEPGGVSHFRGALAPTPPADDGRTLAAVALAVVVAGLGAAAWVWRRRGGAGPGGADFHELLARGTGGWRRPTPGRANRTPAAGRPPTPPIVFEGEQPFGEYRLLGVLGRGGMAVVYRADRRGEVSALKRPLPGVLDDPEFVQRFLREADIGRTLHHPNIVRILDRGEVDTVPYFTMELIAGQTLMERLRVGGALEPREGAVVVAAVGEALDYAHMKGVVHRDLKPSNVMIGDDGIVKVTDYGIARARRFEGLTITGSFLGTPEYVAPETIEGVPADGRSDLYSLGVLFYEVLTGRRPFAADTPFAILRRHLTEEPVPPSLVEPRVPKELEAIVLRLLRKDPAERYAGAEELVVDLRDFLNRSV
jgi:serine/threonine protein kinase